MLSIFRYGSLNGPGRPFVESLHSYGKSLMLLPAFSFGFCTPLCLKAVYSIRDIESPIRPTYFNPEYLQSLALFWRSRGLHGARLSAGLMMHEEIVMKGQISKLFISLMITLLCLGSLLITALWIIVDNSNMETHGPPSPKKIPQWPSHLCKGCRDLSVNAFIRSSHVIATCVCVCVCVCYRSSWKSKRQLLKNLEEARRQFQKTQLRSQCHGFDRAIITQANTPVGSKILFSLEGRKTLHENLFQNKKWDTCAVVGNSGILSNSSCGEMIDSAQFVIRCNLPSLGKGYEKDVGIKTDIVTANPSIIWKNYGDLEGNRRPFVESLRIYGKSHLLLPAFTFARDVPRSLRAVYTAEDFESPIRPVFLNPDYIRKLTLFWSSRGQRKGALSTGLKMVSLALENCANVHLYGFWPFSIHPFEFNAVNNHYFDNRKASWILHAMPDEFDLWLQLHSQGVLRLHLGKCQPGVSAMGLTGPSLPRKQSIGIKDFI
ncbi:hypothetical protein F7725_003128 [Dissostichus mawsoni]|uniref:Uncharacterized protein n=1 Tax=Dissostichus mawsoni TaxID=36200 RepID=A0A7J5Y9F9_DISMA|nr:hypothetical protein F7725_003128 [Dissostichus mawsoni]